MAVLTRAALKAKFENGDTPSALDFIDLIDTFMSRDASETSGTNSATVLFTNSVKPIGATSDYLISYAPGVRPGANALSPCLATYAQLPSDSWVRVDEKASGVTESQTIAFTLAVQCLVIASACGTSDLTEQFVVKFTTDADVLVPGSARLMDYAGGGVTYNSGVTAMVLPAGSYKAVAIAGSAGHAVLLDLNVSAVLTNYI